MPITDPKWEDVEARDRLRRLGAARRSCLEARREYIRMLKPFSLMEEEQAKKIAEKERIALKEAAERMEATKVEEALKKEEPPKELRDVGTQTDAVVIKEDDEMLHLVLYMREVPSP